MKKLIQKIPKNLRIALMVLSVVAVVLISRQMDVSMAPAIEDSDFGIISFEFATNTDRAMEILEAWGSDGRDGATTATQLDYGFLVAYSILLVLATATVAMAASDRQWVRTSAIGYSIAGLVPVAGLLDAIENTALLSTLNAFDTGTLSPTATALASGAAGLKFAIVAFAILYILAAMVSMEFVRVRATTS